MGKVIIEYYECDVCKDRFDKPDRMFALPIAARKYDMDGKRFTKVFSEALLCPKCRDHLWSVSDKFFCEVEIGGGKTEYFLKEEYRNSF